jgi:MFS family permease
MLPSRKIPREAREAYRLDRQASYFAGIYMGAIFPFAAVIARDQLRASAFILSLMTAAPFVGNLCALFWARAMEGRPKLPFMVWSQAIARSFFLLALFATTPLTFALIVSGAQLVATISSPAYAAVIQEIYPEDQRGRIMSYTRAALLTASVLATFAVGPLLEYVSYRWVFPIAGLFGIVSAWIFSQVPTQPVSAPTRATNGRRLRATFAETAVFLCDTLGILKEDRAFRWFALSVFTYGFGNLMLAPVVPIVQVDELHISTAMIAVLANISQLVAAAAYFYWGRFVDRRGPLDAVVVNIGLNLFIPLCYYFATNVWYLVPAFLLSGITMAGIDLSYFNSVLGFAGPQNVTRYQALQSFLLGIRGTIAPFVGGGLLGLFRANGWDLRPIFLVGFAFLLAGCAMQMIGLRRGRPVGECPELGARRSAEPRRRLAVTRESCRLPLSGRAPSTEHRAPERSDDADTADQ